MTTTPEFERTRCSRGKRNNITFWDPTQNWSSVIRSSRSILISWRRSKKPICQHERSRQQGPDSDSSGNSQISLWLARLIGMISSRFGVSARYLVKKLSYSVSPRYWVLPQHCTLPELSEAQQINPIKEIETPCLPLKDIHILEGDPSTLLKNIRTRSGFIKGWRRRAI
jgi:hypothetical protein